MIPTYPRGFAYLQRVGMTVSRSFWGRARFESVGYGYRADGKKIQGNSGGHSVTDYKQNFTTGDVIGAGILLETQEMFFT